MQNCNELTELIEQAAAEQTESQDGACIAEDDLPLVLDFIVESGEHVETAEANVLDLERQTIRALCC